MFPRRIEPAHVARAVAYSLASREPTEQLRNKVFGFARLVARQLRLREHEYGDPAEMLEALSELGFLLEDLSPPETGWENGAHEFGDAVSCWAARYAERLLADGKRVPLAFLEWIEPMGVRGPADDAVETCLGLQDIPLSDGHTSGDYDSVFFEDYQELPRDAHRTQIRLVCAILDAAPRRDALAYLKKVLPPGPGRARDILDETTAAAAEIWRVSAGA